jgi:hypothetical protein
LNYESFLDKHSIINDDLVKCTPYIVNIKFMVLICTDCRYCVNPDRALEHLRRDHPHCKVESTFSEHLTERFPGLLSESIQPHETIEAVFGLAIPVDIGTAGYHVRRLLGSVGVYLLRALALLLTNFFLIVASEYGAFSIPFS